MSKLNQTKKIALLFALLGIVFISLSYAKISSQEDEFSPDSNGDSDVYEEIRDVENKIGEDYSTEITPKERNSEKDSEKKVETKEETETENYYEVAGDNNFTLIVEDDSFPALFDEEDSLYEAMSKMKEFDLINFEEKSFSGLGVYIYSINNISENKKEGEYWIYYINDVQANVGVSNYYLDEGDEIRWQLETNTY
ncbi:MAG: DUF4430 domain-containing protein [Bacteriovoracia bacterium]